MSPTTTFAKLKERASALLNKRKKIEEHPQQQAAEMLTWETEWAKYLEEVKKRSPQKEPSLEDTAQVSGNNRPEYHRRLLICLITPAAAVQEALGLLLVVIAVHQN
jgi:hypothetical protein